MQTQLLFIVCAALFAGRAALAQPVPASISDKNSDAQKNFERRFTQLDRNGDGAIDREEAAAHAVLSKHFDDIDVNKDGRLSREELQTQRQEHRNRFLSRFDEQFTAADKDGDGALTRAEAEAGRMGRIVEHFDRIDANRDGKVTREELRAIMRFMPAS